MTLRTSPWQLLAVTVLLCLFVFGVMPWLAGLRVTVYEEEAGAQMMVAPSVNPGVGWDEEEWEYEIRWLGHPVIFFEDEECLANPDLCAPIAITTVEVGLVENGMVVWRLLEVPEDI